MTSLVAAYGGIWVSGFGDGPDGNQRDVVERIDPKTSRVVATICMQGIPGREWGGGDMAAAGGYVWVAGYTGHGKTQQGLLQRIDPKTNEVTKIAVLGTGVADLATGPSGFWALAVVSRNVDEVARLDPSSGKTRSETTFKAPWIGSLLLAGKQVWVSERSVHNSTVGARYVARIVPASSEQSTVDTGSASAEPIVFDGNIWSPTGGSLEVINPTTERIQDKVHVGYIGYDLAAADGAIWFLGAQNEGHRRTVARYDASSGEVDLVLPLRTTPTAIAVGPGKSVWILNYEGSITKVSVR